MKLSVDTNKHFARSVKRLIRKYGDPLAKLNGFSDSQLDYTEFISNFIDTDTVADASIDGNANVGHKDIVTLINEMPKPHEKVLAFNKIYCEIEKEYGRKTADKWLKAEWCGYLYTHDSNSASWVSYCFAYDLKDLAEKGLFFIDDFNAEPPKHLETFVDFVKEFVSWNCNRTSGAVGLPNLIPYMYYFWKKDKEAGIFTDDEKARRQQIQRLIYGLNQPFLRGGIQSAFTNTSVFDHPYLEALFGGAQFPDGTFMIDDIEGIMGFQKVYMEVMSEIRAKNVMTFPVSTISLLKQNGKFVDEDFARWACAHNLKWADSNIFVDSSVTSLSNCCFDGSQKCLSKSRNGVNYMTFEDLYNSPCRERKSDLTVFHNGNWVDGKVIRQPGRPMYRIVTANNKEMLLTDNHICVTSTGEKTADSITDSDYIMFSTKCLNPVHEADSHLTYAQGYLIGMYLGDGSMEDENVDNHTPIIHLSLNEEKYSVGLKYLKEAVGDDVNVVLGTQYNNVYPVRITDKNTYEFIRRFVSGKYCYEKRLNESCILQSVEFRKGILDGYYLTDGGNSNRIYTTSKELVGDVELLCTSLGLQTIINVTDRTGVDCVVIRGRKSNRNYPIYCIRWYESYRRHQKDLYVWKNNSIYFKVKSVERLDNIPEYVYCFEMSNEDEPYFTLPNGIITHNCRLKSNIKDLGYFNSIAGSALKVGSIKVSTVNLARLALESETEDEYLDKLEDMVGLDLVALDRIRHIITRNVEKGLLKNFALGIIDFAHCYNTVGFIGIYETMKKFGYVETDKFGNSYYSGEADKFGRRIFDVIHKTKNAFADSKGYMVNCEQIPGESAAAKLMKKDKIFHPDTVIEDLPLYGNQFMPLGVKTTLKERVRVASLFDNYCNGGSILHVNIDAPFNTFEQAWDMLNYISDAGVTYFAFNTKINACKHNHGFYGSVCPECGEAPATEYSRIVGFLVPTKTYSKERKEEFKLREWEPVGGQ